MLCSSTRCAACSAAQHADGQQVSDGADIVRQAAREESQCCHVKRDSDRNAWAVMAADFALQLAVNNFALQVCKALQACNASEDIAVVLRAIESLVQLAATRPDLASAQQCDLPTSLAECYALILRELHRTVHWQASMLHLILRHLEPITFSLLPGTAPAFSCELFLVVQS